MNLTSDIPPVVFDKLPVVPLVGSVPLPGPAHQVDLSPEVFRWFQVTEASQTLPHVA